MSRQDDLLVQVRLERPNAAGDGVLRRNDWLPIAEARRASWEGWAVDSHDSRPQRRSVVERLVDLPSIGGRS